MEGKVLNPNDILFYNHHQIVDNPVGKSLALRGTTKAVDFF